MHECISVKGAESVLALCTVLSSKHSSVRPMGGKQRMPMATSRITLYRIFAGPPNVRMRLTKFFMAEPLAGNAIR